MIREQSFDHDNRASAGRALRRLAFTCFVASSLVGFAVARELRIRDELRCIPRALSDDRDSLRQRHDAIVELLGRHHVWAGAFGVRRELDELVRSLHGQERAADQLARERAAEASRDREEAEAARNRGLVFAERHRFDLALDEFRRAIEIADAAGAEAWSDGSWEHRAELLVDIAALEARGERRP